MRAPWSWFGSGVALLTLGVGLWWGIESYRYSSELALAHREMGESRYGAARERLARLSALWSEQGEVEYRLGLCEEALGRPDAALTAWGRVPDGTAYAGRASLRRGELAMERGRFALAEDVLTRAARATGPEAASARLLLADLVWRQGRDEEALKLLEANWQVFSRPATSSPAAALDVLRHHIALSLFPLPVERIKAMLERASLLVPDDDRVWLAHASLAIRTGRFDEARKWLEDCLRRRPDDPAVWQARLECALAADRTTDAREALAHLRVRDISLARVDPLRAWFAAHRGDAEAERRALDRWIEKEPRRITPLERRAELALRAGDSQLAGVLRQRKAALDQALDRYKDLYVESAGDLDRFAPEMARLAQSLGFRFQARAFLTRILWRHPGDLQARAAVDQWDRDRVPDGPTNDRSLAEVLAIDLDSSPGHDSRIESEAPPLTIPRFRDDAQGAGLSFVFDNGSSRYHQLPEAGSGGVGLLDYDGDGWIDVYAVQGGPFPPDPGRSCGDRLFRNRGGGCFEDVTERSGISRMAGGYGHGVAVGDYDNDGRPDLFITRWRAYALYQNRGDGTFDDVTAAAGLDGDRDWPTSAAFADFDNDGDLDLYVCHYLRWDAERPRLCRSPSSRGYVTCMPRLFEALPDRVYRNDGGRFREVTAEAGIADRDGRGLGVVAADLDDDGWIDVYVANDMSANFLFRNKGGFRFEEEGLALGAAASAEGGYQAGMGVACGDLDGDGRFDLAVTNFFGESTTFYQNLGGCFADRTGAIGLSAPSRFLLGFGITMSDLNNDGWLDLLTVNGHVGDYRPEAPYAMPAQLLIGGSSGRLTEVSERAGEPFRLPHLSRGLVAGDLDNDGRVDAVAVAQNEPLIDFHNQTERGHFLVIHLEGVTSNRDGVGARVTLCAEGRPRVAQRVGGGSYQSSSDPRLHFGLGAAQRVERLEVRWPSGRVDRYDDLAADTGYLLREGGSKPEPLKGWKH